MLGATGRSFTVVDGRITAMTTPNYGAFDGPLGRFAQHADPSGYLGSCSPDGTSPRSVGGYPFNATCGAFLATHEQAFVADLAE